MLMAFFSSSFLWAMCSRLGQWFSASRVKIPNLLLMKGTITMVFCGLRLPLPVVFWSPRQVHGDEMEALLW
jgi:hypothetical protein